MLFGKCKKIIKLSVLKRERVVCALNPERCYIMEADSGYV